MSSPTIAIHFLRLFHRRIIDRPPSAELAPDQKDSDSLPDYDVLDAILLSLYVERDKSRKKEIVKEGFDEAVVRRIIRLD